MASIYDYSVPATDGTEVKLADYKGKVMVIVNTATGCGFTPHYEPLEKMYENYHEQGLEIIDVPCNQFAGQTVQYTVPADEEVGCEWRERTSPLHLPEEPEGL